MDEIRNLLAELLKRAPPGTRLPRGRVRLCARCVRLKDTVPELANFTPRAVQSWVDADRRYYSMLCADCAEYERKEREALRGSLAKTAPR